MESGETLKHLIHCLFGLFGKVSLGLVIVSTVSSCSQSNTNDFDIVCNSFTKLQQQPDFDTLSAADRNQWVLTDIAQSLPPDSMAAQAWFAISSGLKDERYLLFTEITEDLGLKGWQCDTMKQIAHQVGAG